MKKIAIYIVMAVLCLNFTTKAQNQIRPAGLKIGDKVPDITITNIINYPTKTAKISDFKGKLLILDFWATWCSPCVAMMPKMDSLQKAFEGKIQFLPVAYQNESEVSAFWKRKKITYGLPDITGDTVLVKMFPHRTLPHYVWINQDGIISQFTGFDAVNKVNIAKQLSQPGNLLRQKVDSTAIPYDWSKPFLINHNGGDSADFIYHSILTKYNPGLKSQYKFDIKDPAQNGHSYINCTNMCLQLLYTLAYSDNKKYIGDNRVILEVKDPNQIITHTLHGLDYRKWMSEGHAYSYEVRIPSKQSANLFKIMREDLNRLFPQYEVSLEKRKKRCLALVRTSPIDKLKSKGGQWQIDFDEAGARLKNVKITQLTGRLDQVYLVNSPYPVIDHTGFTHTVDLTLDANLGDLKSLNMALEKYDLQFVEMDLPVDILFIRDKTI